MQPLACIRTLSFVLKMAPQSCGLGNLVGQGNGTDVSTRPETDTVRFTPPYLYLRIVVKSQKVRSTEGSPYFSGTCVLFFTRKRFFCFLLRPFFRYISEVKKDLFHLYYKPVDKCVYIYNDLKYVSKLLF